eukprot:TRINITY_DN8177_c0_g1_i1.p1 TRINITY_DN8177_c0_g1~~TRINITY_DN8177_c0_g1_i1.p1  ORF type:complete len:373 (+),score=37.94 TRINITY_DN8177_c0_g1_i1:71-1189(+)
MALGEKDRLIPPTSPDSFKASSESALPGSNDKKKRYFISDTNLDTWLTVSISLIYLCASVALPLYNKELLSFFPYPLTAVIIQVGGTTVVLAIFSIVRTSLHKQDLVPKSRLFNHLFFWKCMIMIPAAICYAAVMVLTNVGLLYVSVNVHVLLHATYIIWVVVFAMIMQRELPSPLVSVSMFLLLSGTILISYQLHSTPTGQWWKILINLASPMFEGLLIVILKRIIGVLRTKEPSIRPLEITLIKMGEAFLILIVPAICIEGTRPWSQFNSGQGLAGVLVTAGIFVTSLYQTLTVLFIDVARTTTVGVITQIQIIPQTFLSIVLFKNFDFSPMHIAGTVVTITGVLVFVFDRYWEINRKNKPRDSKMNIIN